MNNNHNTDGPPCQHMEKMLQETADGTSKGWKKLYALSHAARCKRCGTFLDRMRATLTELRGLRSEAPTDAMNRLKSGKWRDEVEKS